ncbi:hypothetical protein FI667_g12265, partial [Globisporangium splendens]
METPRKYETSHHHHADTTKELTPAKRDKKCSIRRSVALSPELPEEAAKLKQQIRAKWPVSVFKFRFRYMKRIVVTPVQIPADLSHARAWAAMVSGIRIPLTKRMWERQKSKFLSRLPDTIDECEWFVESCELESNVKPFVSNIRRDFPSMVANTSRALLRLAARRQHKTILRSRLLNDRNVPASVLGVPRSSLLWKHTQGIVLAWDITRSIVFSLLWQNRNTHKRQNEPVPAPESRSCRVQAIVRIHLLYVSNDAIDNDPAPRSARRVESKCDVLGSVLHRGLFYRWANFGASETCGSWVSAHQQALVDVLQNCWVIRNLEKQTQALRSYFVLGLLDSLRPMSEQTRKALSRISIEAMPVIPKRLDPKSVLVALSMSFPTIVDVSGPKESTKETKIIKDTVALLHASEAVAMIEYIEAVMPIIYALYIAILFHLPNARYSIFAGSRR